MYISLVKEHDTGLNLELYRIEDCITILIIPTYHHPSSCMALQRYNEELAMVAQSFAEQCVFGPNPERATMADSFATVGQNALVTNSRTVDYRALIRDNWFSQQTEYNFDTDTCRSVCNEYRQASIHYNNYTDS